MNETEKEPPTKQKRHALKAKHFYLMAYVLWGAGSLVMVMGLLEWALAGKGFSGFSWVGMGNIWMGFMALIAARTKENAESRRIRDDEETREDR